MASMLLRQHGKLAPVKVAERIGEFAVSGEKDGVALWREVAHRLDALIAQRHRA
jgi:hypothetical protein